MPVQPNVPAPPLAISDYRHSVAKRLVNARSRIQPDYRYNDALLDIDILLSEYLGRPRSFLLSHGDGLLDGTAIAVLEKQVAKRLAGKPIAYIIGRKEFYGLDFLVNKSTLIPKSDTELLVEHALPFCLNLCRKPTSPAPLRLLDICCGTGCIGITVTKLLLRELGRHEGTANGKPAEPASLVSQPQNRPVIRLTLLDVSSAAISVSRQNAERLLKTEIAARTAAVDFITADFQTALFPDKSYDCIVSNPPYVPTAAVTALLSDGRSEPRLALDGGSDGLALYAPLAELCSRILKPAGSFFIEAGEYNIRQAVSLFRQCGFTGIETYHDLSGQPRMFTAAAD